ncbi:odorant receptor Or2-like [Schistocerca piceifrons]|uniref:odorant receptor Or2-like n=1 Tax=Schistocerca piceifrons TaxID=274613 RepID=UPI001F5FA63C|nr:odorant receptor Or2-like [Schistocerca piceifrons]
MRTDARLPRTLLRAVGAWSPRGRPWARRLYAGYSAAVAASLLAFVASQLSAMLHFWGDLLSVTTNACVTFTYSLAVFKLVAFLRMRRSVDCLVADLDRCMQQYGRQLEAEKRAVFAGCARRGLRVSGARLALAAVFYVSWVAQPALRARACESAACRKQGGFPALIWLPFDYAEQPAYEMVYTVLSLGLFYGSHVSTGLDGFFCTLIIYLAGHLRFLNMMLANTCTGVVREAAVSGYKRKKAEASPDPDNQMRSRLRECIRYHNDIDRCVQLLSGMLGPILLGQFIVNIITISATAFIAITLKADSAWIFKYGSYLFAIAVQLLLYCWFGNDIVTESERLQMSAYSSDWTAASPRFRKELRLLLCRAHRPLRLTASKFYTISRETFLALMNASFSYFMVLRELNAE